MSWDWTLLLVADAAALTLATLLVVFFFLRGLWQGKTRSEDD